MTTTSHAKLTIRDDVPWAKHIGNESIRAHAMSLPAGTSLRLIVDGTPIRSHKMRDEKDGRPTPGLRADMDHADSRSAWSKLQEKRGETVQLSMEDGARDPYFMSNGTLPCRCFPSPIDHWRRHGR